MKYHQKYRVAFSAFQSIYTTIIAEQDKLQTSEGSTANAAAASSDQSSNNWQVCGTGRYVVLAVCGTGRYVVLVVCGTGSMWYWQVCGTGSMWYW